MTGRSFALPLLSAALSLTCSRGAEEAPSFRGSPVVLISIDTLRADHLPAYGYSAVETPSIDALRRDSVLFEKAYTHVPLTLPAHVSMLTGLLPPEHRVRDNLGYRYDAKAHPGLPRLLKDRGYATGAAVSAFVLHGDSGLRSDFDLYEDVIEAPAGLDAAGQVQRAGGETAALALKWLESVKEKPFFLFFHIYEPHSPFDPPEPFKSRYALPYDGEIAAADAIVGDFLSSLERQGIYDRSIIVLVSDHGEGLWDHGEEFHGILLYREVLHVPLMLKLPGSARAGTRVAAPVELIDLLPTLASLLGIPTPQGLRGRSLLDPGRRPQRIYGETYYPRIHLGWSHLRSLVDERYHFIEGPDPELYDVARDPPEKENLRKIERDTARSMEKALSGYAENFGGPEEVGSEEMEKLAALGYLGGVAAAGRGPLPDPKQKVHSMAEIKAAFGLSAAGKDEQAVLALRKILEDNPLFLDVWYELGRTLMRLGRYAEAYEAYKAALRSSPTLAGPIALALSRACLELGKLDEAEANAQIALKSNPDQGHEVLARVALSRNDLARAEREASLATRDPVAERSRAVLLAEIHIRRNELPKALAILEGARQQAAQRRSDPMPDLEFLRGDILARLGRHSEAEAAFEEEIRAFPANSQAYARLAIVYGLQRRTFRDVDRLLESMVAARPSRETMLLAAKTLESMGDARGAGAWRRRAGRPRSASLD